MALVPSRKTFDKSNRFLCQRDGIDKVLKLLQYTSKLIVSFADDDSKLEGIVRLRVFSGNISQSRKALRLGKFLGDLNKIIKQQPPLTTRLGALTAISNTCSCTHYFVEQLVWLCKSGIIKDKELERRLGRISAYAELSAYSANITVSMLQLAVIVERETLLRAEMERLRKSREAAARVGDPDTMAQEVEALVRQRRLRAVDLVQDSMDALIAMNEIRAPREGRITSHPSTLAAAGLISAAIGASKAWPPS